MVIYEKEKVKIFKYLSWLLLITLKETIPVFS